MVLKSTQVIEHADMAHSRSAHDHALAAAQEAAIGAVLRAAEEDIELHFSEDEHRLSVSATLRTLNREEVLALSALLRAHAKGYSPATLMPLLSDLARVFRF
jgi:methionine-rich copper-binding protein CopC